MAEQPIRVNVALTGENVPAGRLWTHRHGRSESVGQALFGAFSDCAPDGWGRGLVQRAEQHHAREEGRAPRSLAEIDYLLGVRDDLRQGALRFQEARSDQYLSPDDRGVPHLVDLPRLLHAAEELERDDPSAEDLRILLHGASSLGG